MFRFLRICMILFLSMMSGCMVLPSPQYSDLDLHGKVGKTCTIAGFVVSIPVEIVLSPLTLTGAIIYQKISPAPNSYMLGGLEQIVDIVVAPSLGIQCVFYYAGATITYPIHVVADMVEPGLPPNATDAQALAYYMARMPHLSSKQYNQLVMVSHRSFAPYFRQIDSSDVRYIRGDYLWGTKENMVASYINDEWIAWQLAGQPIGGSAEAGFVLNHIKSYGGNDGKLYYRREVRKAIYGPSNDPWDVGWGRN